MHCVRAVMGEISFGKTTVVASLHASHCLVAGHCGRWFGSVGPGKTLGATWAFDGLSSGRDQPLATISQQLRPV